MPTWIKLQRIADARGGLVIAEAQKNVPFDIKRVYCLYDLNNEPRGFHAHKKLQQVMVCLAGTCEVLLDDGRNREIVKLDKFSDGLSLPIMVWHEVLNCSSDCVLMVLASDYYEEADYIRDYSQFLSNSFVFLSKTLRFRPVEVADADYILKLRIDSQYNQYLSKVNDNKEEQVSWLKKYKEDEKQGKQYYFVIERKDNHAACGLVRLYNIQDDSFTWGSWILDDNKTAYAALESAILVYEIGFEKLGLSKCQFDVMKDNLKVLNFHRKFGAKLIREDEINYYFEITSKEIKKIKVKFEKFL